jgi:hypothetical protein
MGPKEPSSQKHHYIPVFYLKQWGGADGRLCEFSRPHKNVKPRMVHPEGTAYRRGLNTFSRLPPELADFLEGRFFQEVDSQAACVLRMLLQNIVDFDLASASAWSRFLMSLFYRSPEGMERIINKVTTEYPIEFGRIARSRGDIADSETFERLRAQMTDVRLDQLSLLLLHRVMDSENVGTFLNRMRWAVIRTHESRYSLLTSDRPIVMTNGLRDPKSHIVMPISPIRVFAMANNLETLREVYNLMERGGGVRLLNNRMARQARKYVYGTDDLSLSFVEARLGEQAAWSPFE